MNEKINMTKINSYRDLIVWQKAMNLVVEAYKTIQMLPKDEDYVLSLQIRKSVISVPSNIAEGYGRNHTADYARFLEISRGSLFELQTQIEISMTLGYIPCEICNSLLMNSSETEKMLNSLISKLRHGKNS